jgi:hypothetical protein
MFGHVRGQKCPKTPFTANGGRFLSFLKNKKRTLIVLFEYAFIECYEILIKSPKMGKIRAFWHFFICNYKLLVKNPLIVRCSTLIFKRMRYKTIINFEGYDLEKITFDGLAHFNIGENVFLNGLIKDHWPEQVPEGRLTVKDKFSCLEKKGLNDMIQTVHYILE